MAGEPPTGTPDGEVLRLSGIRQVVAKRMEAAWQTVPAVTLHRSASLRHVLAARASLADDAAERPPLDLLLALVVSKVLTDHPLLNASWIAEERSILVHHRRAVAIAVDGPMGLTIIVVRDPDRRAWPEVYHAFREALARVRSGRQHPEDVAGATFTITNLGGYGVDQFNPIITVPQSGVLGIGTGRRVEDDVLAALSLTFDHRVLDGADAARFLAALADELARPLLLRV